MIEEKTTETLPLADTVSQHISTYMKSMGNTPIVNLHAMVLEQIEPPLLKAVMERCKYNQSRAAKMLGLSRGTCRNLLIKYFDEQYCGRQTLKDDA